MPIAITARDPRTHLMAKLLLVIGALLR